LAFGSRPDSSKAAPSNRPHSPSSPPALVAARPAALGEGNRAPMEESGLEALQLAVRPHRDHTELGSAGLSQSRFKRDELTRRVGERGSGFSGKTGFSTPSQQLHSPRPFVTAVPSAEPAEGKPLVVQSMPRTRAPDRARFHPHAAEQARREQPAIEQMLAQRDDELAEQASQLETLQAEFERLRGEADRRQQAIGRIVTAAQELA
jgi:hypothetical protein